MQAVLNTVNPIQTAIRSIFVTLDMGIYDLLKFMYELFFHIATNNLIDREMIFNIFSRVQLVIGIFMMFQLVMIVIKGIVNPDSFTDSKSGGAGSMIMRIIVALALLAVIVPINIPSPRNEYEKQINNNGLLFGTLYSLQYRVLANNTLGRIILDDKDVDYTDGGTGVQDLSLFANRFTTAVVKVFYTLNTDENGDYVCNDGFDSTYKTEGINPNIIIINGTQACGSGNFIMDTVGQVLKQGQQYRITMNWLSTIIGIVLVVLFFMMIFNVAKRVFKLAALQLIAPIPIISYMDPKGSKDGAFNSWVKMLTTTYLELFVQLAVVYFSFAIINSFITKFFNVNNVTSSVGNAFNGDAFHATGLLSWTFIIMTIALFIFAKDAPKFLKQALGIKTERSFFDSFGQALGVGAMAAGTVSSGIAGAVSKYESTSGNKGKKVRAAILGGLGGAAGGTVNAGRTFFKSKDGAAGSIMEGNRRYASQLYANAADESTPLGRFVAGAQSNLGLQNELQKFDNKIKYYSAGEAAYKRMDTAFNSDTTKVHRQGNNLNSSNGETLLVAGTQYSTKSLNDLYNRMVSSGRYSQADLDAVDSIKKEAQFELFKNVVMTKHNIDNDGKGLIDTQAQIFQAAKTIHQVGTKYGDDDDQIYKDYRGTSLESFINTVTDKADFGTKVKGAAYAGGRQKETIKNSSEYAQASANAKRAQEAGKKK